MNKTVKLTKIEKKYKDKKTGEYKTLTINFAKVADRLNEFREANPRGMIKTSYEFIDKNLVFTTYILKDKKDKNSADSTGHAMAIFDGSEKQFEKLETISVGRALALLGYSAGGEIASSEEMEEFNEYKEDKLREARIEAIFNIESSKTIDELRKNFMNSGMMFDEEVIAAKDKMKEKL